MIRDEHPSQWLHPELNSTSPCFYSSFPNLASESSVTFIVCSRQGLQGEAVARSPSCQKKHMGYWARYSQATALRTRVVVSGLLTSHRSISVENGQKSSKNIIPSEKMSTFWLYASPPIWNLQRNRKSLN